MSRSFCLLILTAVISVPAAVDAKTTQQIRVLSYNIHHGQGTDGKLDLERIANVIQSVSPDLVALQEVDKHAKRSGSVDQAAELARLTGMKHVFGGNIDLQGGEYGNAVLSKHAINDSQNVSLPNHNDGEQRGLLRVSVNIGEAVTLLATHFDHRPADSERLASAARVNAIVEHSDVPTILAGDMNATRDTAVLRELQKAWTVAGDQEQPTIPVAKPNRQIDFVMVRPANRWRVVETRVLQEAVASDHRAILAVLELKPSKAVTRLPANKPLQYHDADGAVSIAKNPKQWESRRQSILRGMHSVMGPFPKVGAGEKFTVDTMSEEDCGSYVRRLVAYRLGDDEPTPAFLCIPKPALKANAKTPAVLCLHPTDNVNGHKVVVGLGGKANRQYASELAERGYVTLSPSYPLLANYQPDLTKRGWQSGTLKAVWDNMRGIDFLQSLPFVDADAIGAIGHSLGGHNAVYTAVFDERIKAVVSSCGLDSYVDYYDGNPKVWVRGKGWTSNRYMPALANYAGRLEEIPFDFHEMLGCLAPRHVLIVAPLHDGNFRARSVDRVVAAAQQVYQLHDASHRLQVVHPDCDHDFPQPMRARAYTMFDRVLMSQH